ncbi:hypothetical protein ACS0TY_000644 [Phlomoides rotata]
MVVVAAVVPERNMEAVEEAPAPPTTVAKGKRTKRQRLLSPIPITIVPPTHYTGHLPPITPPFYTASSEESTTTEEENTAWCLVLLSQGHFQNDNTNSRRHDEATTTSYGGATKATRNGGGTCMYTCKTCNRSFSSFQALGGHRASHRKPKNEKKPVSDDEDFPSLSYLQLSSVSSATVKSSPSPRMHVCSSCGAEFTSGQALGGHMRKHRGAGPIKRSFNFAREELGPGPEELKEVGIGISLDLNLPVAEDEREKSPKEANQRFCLPLLLHH